MKCDVFPPFDSAICLLFVTSVFWSKIYFVQKYDIEIREEFEGTWGLALFQFKDFEEEETLGRHVHQRYTNVLGRSKEDPVISIRYGIKN